MHLSYRPATLTPLYRSTYCPFRPRKFQPTESSISSRPIGRVWVIQQCLFKYCVHVSHRELLHLLSIRSLSYPRMLKRLHRAVPVPSAAYRRRSPTCIVRRFPHSETRAPPVASYYTGLFSRYSIATPFTSSKLPRPSSCLTSIASARSGPPTSRYPNCLRLHYSTMSSATTFYDFEPLDSMDLPFHDSITRVLLSCILSMAHSV